MKFKSIIAAAAGAVALFSACTEPIPTSYTVTGLLPDSSANGKEAYLLPIGSRQPIDTAVVEGNKFVFDGVANEPVICTVRVTGARVMGGLILENGNINIELASGRSSFAPIGTANNELFAQIFAIGDTIKPQNVKAEAAKWFAQYNDGIIGEALFMSPLFQGLDDDTKLATIEGFSPALREKDMVKSEYEVTKAVKATAPGQKFTDFKGTSIDGKEVSFSDFVGKGNYTLVDFWASWCGPCKMEIPNIIEVNNLYKDKGLTVLGVFVWDEVKNLEPAMKEEKITWAQMIDSEKVATKIYGIDGIPSIMLVGPDGTILERGGSMRGENMKATVEKYLLKK